MSAPLIVALRPQSAFFTFWPDHFQALRQNKLISAIWPEGLSHTDCVYKQARKPHRQFGHFLCLFVRKLVTSSLLRPCSGFSLRQKCKKSPVMPKPQKSFRPKCKKRVILPDLLHMREGAKSASGKMSNCTRLTPCILLCHI